MVGNDFQPGRGNGAFRHFQCSASLPPTGGGPAFDNGRGLPPAVSAPGAAAVQTKGRGHEHRVPVRTATWCKRTGSLQSIRARRLGELSADAVDKNWLTPAGKAVQPITYYDMACEKFIERRERHGTDPETEEA